MKEDEVKLLEKIKKIVWEVGSVLSSKLLTAIEIVNIYAPRLDFSLLIANTYRVTFKVSDTECGSVPVDRLITIEFNDCTLDDSVMLPIDKLANINTTDQHQIAVLRIAYTLFLAVKEARHPELGANYANTVLNHSIYTKVAEIKNMYDSPAAGYSEAPGYCEPESEVTKAEEDAADSPVTSAISGTSTTDASTVGSVLEMTEEDVEETMHSSVVTGTVPYSYADCVSYTVKSLDSDTLDELKKKISDLEDKMSVFSKYFE